MARKKAEAKKEEVIVKEAVKPSYGTGMTRINNMLKAGYKINEIREAERNE